MRFWVIRRIRMKISMRCWIVMKILRWAKGIFSELLRMSGWEFPSLSAWKRVKFLQKFLTIRPTIWISLPFFTLKQMKVVIWTKHSRAHCLGVFPCWEPFEVYFFFLLWNSRAWIGCLITSAEYKSKFNYITRQIRMLHIYCHDNHPAKIKMFKNVFRLFFVRRFWQFMSGYSFRLENVTYSDIFSFFSL